MKLTCKECGSPIPASDINISRLLAKCGSCNSVFSFDDKPNTNIKKQNSGIDLKNIPIPSSKIMKIKESGGNLEIEIKWFRWLNVLITLAAIWSVYSTYHWITASIANRDWTFDIYTFVIAGLSIILPYKALTGYVNKTVITINPQNFIVKLGPLPWRGNQNLNTSDVVQLYSKRVRLFLRSDYFLYEVHGILKNGIHLPIAKSLITPEHAYFLEHKIEDFLQLEDVSVQREMRK